MKLVIAEKPSVAQSIARVIGAAGRKDGYLEGNGYLVSWCVGHLVELSAPETYDERYPKWRLEDLPVYFFKNFLFCKDVAKVGLIRWHQNKRKQPYTHMDML